jgi:hypothetical protein
MKLSDKLLVIASWLENDENEIFQDADKDEKSLETVANYIVKAAYELRKCAEEIATSETVEEEPVLTPEKLDELAAVAEAFDQSDDELLKKQASVLDELLLTLASPKNAIFNFKAAEEKKIDDLKKKYKEPKQEIDEMNKMADQLKDIEKSPFFKQFRPLETSLSTRYCPDHAGVQITRVGENLWQCAMDKKTYDFANGFTTMKGNKVPGGSVDLQTPPSHQESHMIFDTRSSKLGQ